MLDRLILLPHRHAHCLAVDSYHIHSCLNPDSPDSGIFPIGEYWGFASGRRAWGCNPQHCCFGSRGDVVGVGYREVCGHCVCSNGCLPVAFAVDVTSVHSRFGLSLRATVAVYVPALVASPPVMVYSAFCAMPADFGVPS
ncbi:hypothetical protein R83H12_00281 [Fibrobacteria bacterium R8-3-H12]